MQMKEQEERKETLKRMFAKECDIQKGDKNNNCFYPKDDFSEKKLVPLIASHAHTENNKINAKRRDWK